MAIRAGEPAETRAVPASVGSESGVGGLVQVGSEVDAAVALAGGGFGRLRFILVAAGDARGWGAAGSGHERRVGLVDVSPTPRPQLRLLPRAPTAF